MAGALIVPRFLDCVMAIGYRPLVIERKHDGKFELKRGDFDPTASGFLYGEFIKKVNETKSRYQVYLVTNTHVLKDIEQAELEQIRRFKKQRVEAPKAFASFNPMGEGPAIDDWVLPLRDKDGAPGYIAHHDADVAVVSIDPGVLDKAKMTYRFFRSNLDVADRDKASELGFSEGDGIYILGFPMNLVGEGRNYVIAREGSIARDSRRLSGHDERVSGGCACISRQQWRTSHLEARIDQHKRHGQPEAQLPDWHGTKPHTVPRRSDKPTDKTSPYHFRGEFRLGIRHPHGLREGTDQERHGTEKGVTINGVAYRPNVARCDILAHLAPKVCPVVCPFVTLSGATH